MFWVSYEDVFIRFGFELIRMKLFHISFVAPNFKETTAYVSLNHSSHGVISMELRGALFKVNAVVSNA